MKVFVILFCFLPAALCWDFPGYPGVDCPTAYRKMSEDPERGWMLPKCNEDGTFQNMQCYDEHPQVPDPCMCCDSDGSPITLPGFGLDIQNCVCLLAGYEVSKHDPEAEMPNCEKTGYYAPLQCSKIRKECWCVDKNGNVLVPPSPNVHSCENVA